MKIVFKTRSPLPLYRILLFLLLTLGSAYFYFLRDAKDESPVRPTMMAIAPIIPDLQIIQPAPTLTTQTVPIPKNETFTDLMKDSGFDAPTVQSIYDSAKPKYDLARIQAGNSLIITTGTDHSFSKLEYEIDPIQTLVVRNLDGMMNAELARRQVEMRVQELGGFIKDSLYATIDRLGEEDQLVIDFADIFEWDVDFFKDLQEGDSFRIVYERQYVDGEPGGYGKILAAELTNKGRAITALGFHRGNKFEFFSPDGKAMRKAFLASPLKFSRIASGFTRSRYHPILKRYRPHYGIDYAAPAGTSVRAIGSGKVILAGWAGGAGKTIKLQHNKEIATVYCHLSRFAAGVAKGRSVSQGQVIGYVGSTGLATGPHLDFRYLRNGRYINFLSIKSPQAEPLSASELDVFRTASVEIGTRLAAVEMAKVPLEIASVSPEPSPKSAR